jgi:hypothetical protein
VDEEESHGSSINESQNLLAPKVSSPAEEVPGQKVPPGQGFGEG